MSNLVFYRKYRPQNFSDLIGQEHVVKTITNAISENAVSHAYLFSGPRGSGKTTMARLLAKAVNCENLKKYEPCNKCASCLEVSSSRAMDLIEIDAASNRGIDEIRELREGIKFSPSKLKYKVFILDEAHQLSKDAANALLKTLEEPPSHAIFILATTEIHKMIPTIVSRCQRFDFRKLTMPEILQGLEIIVKKEKIKIEKKALELIALSSGGALRDAIGLLDQVFSFIGEKQIIVQDLKNFLGLADVSLLAELTDYLILKDIKGALEFLERVFEKGYDPQEFLRDLVRYLRQLMILKLSPETSVIISLTKEEEERIKEQGEKFLEKEIIFAVNNFLEAENKTKYSSIPQLPLEIAVVEVIENKE